MVSPASEQISPIKYGVPRFQISDFAQISPTDFTADFDFTIELSMVSPDFPIELSMVSPDFHAQISPTDFTADFDFTIELSMVSPDFHECQHQVSDKASVCPKCGAQIGASTSLASSPTSKRKTSPFAWAMLLIIAIGIVWYFQSSSYREQSLPPMPVEIKYRSAILGSGLVVAVNNTSDRYLSILATFKNPSLNQEKNLRIDVPPRGKTEVGHHEGWAFTSGDLITLTHNDYKSWKGSIP